MFLIRPALPDDADSIAAVMITSMQGVLRGRVPDSCLAWITHEESAANWRRSIVAASVSPSASFRVAVDGEGEIAGYIFAEQRAVGGGPMEIYGMSVRTTAQRASVGRALLRQCALDVIAAGIQRVVVRCLTVNPSCRFWERMGPRKLGEEPFDWNGVLLQSAIYVWDDIAAVLTE